MVKGHPRRVPLFSSIFVTLVLVLALARAAPAIEMLGDITVEPTMVKGPPTAPVTIVEFSDYQ
jgi:protein-disulfide isomerase